MLPAQPPWPSPHGPALPALPRSPARVFLALVTPNPGHSVCGPSSPPGHPEELLPRLTPGSSERDPQTRKRPLRQQTADCRNLKKCGILSPTPGPLSQECSF